MIRGRSRGFAGGAIAKPGNSHYVEGVIEGSMMISSGLGYSPGDTGSIDMNTDAPALSLRAKPTSLATYTVTGVGPGGAVTKYNLHNKGSGYIVGEAGTTRGPSKPGTGVGLKISISRLS